ncbi:hypothetical protein A2318_02830 [Candidatus Uhrbacteria bacterium RIFOXYB2_FULL_45_11]|uniref:Uncharacterized protein n=1 Tax=Candidatus Uhrbacteria bacterium RIFOXYB2_FULL_45_11 TaxID=1802421 RepID=A0A1F7W397_9BACT|nr:MAG: hypothetical protein A2318_02830 [Candidatus Uhrbacteria bacterium RIFOXYB2_FULL_45_11]
MIHTCLRAVTESTYSRIPAPNKSVTDNTQTQAYKIELAPGDTMKSFNTAINFVQNITTDDVMEMLGKVTHPAMISALCVGCLVGIPLFGK